MWDKNFPGFIPYFRFCSQVNLLFQVLILNKSAKIFWSKSLLDSRIVNKGIEGLYYVFIIVAVVGSHTVVHSAMFSSMVESYNQDSVISILHSILTILFVLTLSVCIEFFIRHLCDT